MENSSNKKILPNSIMIMLTAVGVLSVLMVFDVLSMSPHEKELVRGFIFSLLFIVFLYFVFRKPFAFIKRKIAVKSEVSYDQPLEGFTVEIVEDKGFSFCYPKTWFAITAKDPVLYKEVREQVNEPGILGSRNFNISIHDIRNAPDLNRMYTTIINGVLVALKGAVLEFKQKFKTDKTLGVKYKVVYNNAQGLNLACYQVVITTLQKKNMLIFTFTSQVNDFDQSKGLFDQIAAQAKIFD